MANKNYDLAHTKWMCKYHIVFTPKYRRKVIYNQLKVDIRDILKQLCSYKGVEIIEGHLMPDHIHMLVSIPPKMSVSSFMGYLKGKSALMIFDRHANLKYKFGNRHFWSEGYYVSTVGLNEATIKKYIQDQEKNDIMQDKLGVKVGLLSGGQRQAMALLMTTMSPIEILILDEHTAALDPKTAEIIMELTNNIVKKKKITTLMVTHNLMHALHYGNRLIMMHEGNAIMDLNEQDKKSTSVDNILNVFNKISLERGN